MRLNIGSGSSRIKGYHNVDTLPLPGVDIVAPADKVPLESCSIDEILVEHLIEHLTFREASRALVEWWRLLKVGGQLTLECPDLEGLCKQFLESNEFGRYTSYQGYWPIIAHFYGHQRGENKEGELAQVHKSGYTFGYMTEMLQGCGFENISRLQGEKGVPGTTVLRVVCTKCNLVQPNDRFSPG